MRIIIQFTLLIMLLSGCKSPWDDYRTVKQNKEGAIHLYLDSRDTGSSLSSTIRKDTAMVLDTFLGDETYRKYTYLRKASIQGHVVFVDAYYGLIVYKKEMGSQGYYLNVIGAYAVDATDSIHLTVSTSIGKAILNLEKPNNPIVESFVFEYPGYGPPISYSIRSYLTRKHSCVYTPCSSKYYFQCPTGSDKIIFGWKIGLITTDPICYQYTN
ncbi:MAG: hypothetical protein R2852_04485 [Bacteroidia bacterium]